MKSLVESIFGDNVKSSIKINGVEISESDWNKCCEYYQKRRKKYFGKKSTVVLGDLEYKYKIVYNKDDGLIAINAEESDNTDWGQDIYILSPETIYMNHKVGEIVDGKKYVFSLDDVDDANDFDICFNWYPHGGGTWYSLYGCHNLSGKTKASNANCIINGYIPQTISDKAKSIIEYYIKTLY